MTTLAKIAAEMRKWCRDDGAAAEQVVTEWASQLEALAGAEPVAWRWRTKSSTPCDRDWTNWLNLPAPSPQKIGPMQEVECAYAAPKRMTVSREALMDAFSIYADPQTVRVMYSVEKLRALGIEVT